MHWERNNPSKSGINRFSLVFNTFIMSPVIKEINNVAYKPFKENQITQEEALANGVKP